MNKVAHRIVHRRVIRGQGAFMSDPSFEKLVLLTDRIVCREQQGLCNGLVSIHLSVPIDRQQ